MVVMASEAERHRLSQLTRYMLRRARGGWAWLKVLEPPCATRHGRARKKGRAGGGGEAKAAENGVAKQGAGRRWAGRRWAGRAKSPRTSYGLQGCGGSSRATANNGSVAGLPLGPGAVLPSGRREDGASLVRVVRPIPNLHSSTPVCREEECSLRRAIPPRVMLGEVGLAVRHPLSSLLTPSRRNGGRHGKGGACSTAGNGMRSPLPQSKEIPSISIFTSGGARRRGHFLLPVCARCEVK
jgi:hypothetical protein